MITLVKHWNNYYFLPPKYIGKILLDFYDLFLGLFECIISIFNDIVTDFLNDVILFLFLKFKSSELSQNQSCSTWYEY